MPPPDSPAPTLDAQLGAEVFLPSARGGRRQAEPLTIEVTRQLTIEDIKRLASEATPASPDGSGILAIRQSHHHLAQCIVHGHDLATISMMTGYSPAYISTLQRSPAFAELIDYYSVLREKIYANVSERMQVLGVSFLDEIQKSLEADPGSWSNREKLEAAEMLLVKGRAGSGSPGGPNGGAGAGINIHVEFVKPADTAASASIASGPASGPIIEGDSRRG